mmetsp:Transcript_42738/g.89282  ORF Transcript_42738/g.89282 Transcript_42738/m.89282 type:complete len:95 (+) Transcript_42738:156-440(+)|eukprot:6213474-Pleurochrysis_carterae.AAC.3
MYVVELDQRDDMAACQDVLLHMTDRHSVPQVFVGGVTIGGCYDVFTLHDRGDLASKLIAAGCGILSPTCKELGHRRSLALRRMTSQANSLQLES